MLLGNKNTAKFEDTSCARSVSRACRRIKRHLRSEHWARRTLTIRALEQPKRYRRSLNEAPAAMGVRRPIPPPRCFVFCCPTSLCPTAPPRARCQCAQSIIGDIWDVSARSHLARIVVGANVADARRGEGKLCGLGLDTVVLGEEGHQDPVHVLGRTAG